MMHPLRTLALSVVGLCAASSSAFAGWNNVFQVCCNDRPRASTSYAAPAGDDCCPKPEARVSYVQRCYYQPVTEYKRESHYVPIKENVRSSYYEPVTSMRYTSYYDPCSGQCQQLAVPQTSYRLREQCNSVTRWVEQTRTVPVTSYKQVTMYQPVVTYYYPPVSSTSSFSLPTAPPYAPRIDELRQNPPAQMPSNETTPLTIPSPGLQTAPSSQPRTMPPATSKPTTGISAYTASRRGSIRGEVVTSDQFSPRPGTKLVFVSAANNDEREYAKANEFGEFDVKLQPGEWHVYMGNGDGRAVYYKKIRVSETDNRNVTLVSR